MTNGRNGKNNYILTEPLIYEILNGIKKYKKCLYLILIDMSMRDKI
jgi:hypothetical protein